MQHRLSDFNPDIPDDYNDLLDTEQYDELIARMYSDYAEFSQRLSSFDRLRQRVYILGAVILIEVLKMLKRFRRGS